jgi:hypothetical protein
VVTSEADASTGTGVEEVLVPLTSLVLSLRSVGKAHFRVWVVGFPSPQRRRPRAMTDDTFCLFVILTCMTTLAVPEPGQIIVAVFGFILAVLARFAPGQGDTGHPGHLDQRGVERRRHAG